MVYGVDCSMSLVIAALKLIFRQHVLLNVSGYDTITLESVLCYKESSIEAYCVVLTMTYKLLGRCV